LQAGQAVVPVTVAAAGQADIYFLIQNLYQKAQTMR
jgi:hypothetical protein